MKIRAIITAAALITAGVVTAVPADAHQVTCKVNAGPPSAGQLRTVQANGWAVCDADAMNPQHITRLEVNVEIQYRTRISWWGSESWYSVPPRAVGGSFTRPSVGALAIIHCVNGEVPRRYRTLVSMTMYGDKGPVTVQADDKPTRTITCQW